LHQTLWHFFPNLSDLLASLEDCRERCKYSITEIIVAGLALFLFKQGSRNAFNNLREERKFKQNYHRLFKARLPHLDTVDNVMRVLPEAVLEELKHKLVQILLTKKVWHNQRLFGKYFVIAVDATGVANFKEKHCEQCLHQTSKKGKVSYFHQVLEAKLITASGFCISLMTEWIENPETNYKKQDCERKAFVRLAERLKKAYPRLPICLTADSLYPSEGFFETCKVYDWRYILTFKEGTIPTLAQKAEAMEKDSPQRKTDLSVVGKKHIEEFYSWANGLNYKGYKINWLECWETVATPEDKELKISRFVHLTNLEAIEAENVAILSHNGRMRWKIENEGFNEQKNSGFEMSHKYSRVNYLAMKNYYQCLQIAHLFTQLMILNSRFQARLHGKTTRKHLWLLMIASLLLEKLCSKKLKQYTEQKIQIRFLT